MTIEPITTSGQSIELDESAWVKHLESRIELDWRPGEWDWKTYVFRGDAHNPNTGVWECIVDGCDALNKSLTICKRCAKHWDRIGCTREEFLGLPPQPRRRTRPDAKPQSCIVTFGKERCPLSPFTKTLCQGHYKRWRSYELDTDQPCSLQQWASNIAGPYNYRVVPGECPVKGCLERIVANGLCPIHSDRYRRENKPEFEPWVKSQLPYLPAGDFALTLVSDIVRVEIIFALQQRDLKECTLSPDVVRAIANDTIELDCLAKLTITESEELANRRTSPNWVSTTLDVLRTIRNERSRWLGESEYDKDVLDLLELGVGKATSRQKIRRQDAHYLDLRQLEVPWLRDIFRAWVKDLIEHDPSVSSEQLRKMRRSALIAQEYFVERPDLGLQPEALTRDDVGPLLDQFTNCRTEAGVLYGQRSRQLFFVGFFDLIDFARAEGFLPQVHLGFNRTRYHRVPKDAVVEEKPQGALPDFVIRHLDANLASLTGQKVYHAISDKERITRSLQHAYLIIRDTGRRPYEVCSLKRDCLQKQGDDWVLLWDNKKAGRYGRRLIILESTANHIREWQQYRDTLNIEPDMEEYLFPAITNSPPEAHMTSLEFGRAIRVWVDQTLPIETGEVDENGAPKYYDKSLIFPYAFRHTYAQRLADSGVELATLRAMMDHQSSVTTLGYYTISEERRREATKLLAPHSVDRNGDSRPFGELGYELKSVAVPFGSCSEPHNVKAGGQKCRFRFQCSGCPHFSADPSHLPALRVVVGKLRVELEDLERTDIAAWVMESRLSEIQSFEEIIFSLESSVASMTPDAQKSIEAASAELNAFREARLIPLEVITHE